MSNFAFLVHPRHLQDVYNSYPYAAHIPRGVMMKVAPFVPPFVVGHILGLQCDDDTPITGDVVTVPMIAQQMLASKKRARKKVVQAMHIAKKRGATMVGLGAFTSVVSDGGKSVRNAVQGLHVTNGNALTASMTFAGIRKALELHHRIRPTIAVIGATGSIGSAVTKLILQQLETDKVFLVGKRKESVHELLKEIERLKIDTERVHVETIDCALPQSDLVITATNATSALIKANQLKKNAIVYDIAQPQNVHPDIITSRTDVLVLDGALVQLPDAASCTVPMHTPEKTTFSCVAETALLALERYPDNFCVGNVTLEQVAYIETLAYKHKFCLAPLTSWGKRV